MIVSSTKTTTIIRGSKALKVSCPIVAEPGVDYKCGFAALAGSTPLAAEFQNEAGELLPSTKQAYTPISKISKIS